MCWQVGPDNNESGVSKRNNKRDYMKEFKLINWAVIGTGGVATEFTSQFDKDIEELYAVYSRSLNKAKIFDEEKGVWNILIIMMNYWMIKM